MKNTFFLLTLSFVLTNCSTTDKNKVGTCCDKTYTNVDNAIKCLSNTNDGNGTTADERLLLIAFVHKDIEANQKLGWDIIKDKDIIRIAKRNYALVITDVDQYKIPGNDCALHITESIKNNSGKNIFCNSKSGSMLVWRLYTRQ